MIPDWATVGELLRAFDAAGTPVFFFGLVAGVILGIAGTVIVGALVLRRRFARAQERAAAELQAMFAGFGLPSQGL